MRFQNKVVIVTGGSSGIGADTALLIAKEGGKVVIVGRNQDKLDQIERTSEKNGNKVFVINADVSKDDDATRIIEYIINKFGKLDVLVNNAGIFRKDSILDANILKNYDEVMNTNVRAVINLTTLAAPHLIKTKGNIVNISSIFGKSFPKTGNVVSYCLSKAAVDHFTRGAALELGVHGVRVNTVSPGPVITDILENAGIAGADWAALADVTVLNRVSTVEECSKLIAFLASDDAVGVTASDYVVDNGYLIKK